MQNVEKPYPDFPLTPHRATGRWCKKTRGHIYYLGPLDDWEASLQKFNDEKDAWYAGRKPRASQPKSATVKDLVNHFWNSKRMRCEAGKITRRTLDDYTRICT